MRRRPVQFQPGRLRSQALRGHGLLAAFLLVWGGAGSLARAQQGGIISGRVTNSQGQPQSVLVHLFAEGELPAGDAYTDSNGYYVFLGLSSGTYAVVVEVEGYRPFRGTAWLDEKVEPRGQVMAVLEPLPKEAGAKPPLIAGSKSAQEISAKHPLPPLNPKAAKEFDKGNKERRNGNNGAALEHYRKALRIDANFYPALNNMGAILEQQGQHAQAHEAFVRAAKINPDDGEAYINIGHMLYEEGQFRAALDELKQGLQRSPQSAAGNFFLGSAYFKLHDGEKAEPLLKTACALDPRHMAPAHLQLANLYLQRRDYAAAKVQLQTFLQLNPTAPQASAIKKTLAEMEKIGTP